MSQNEVVGIDIVARLDDFRAQLADIPKIGEREARALTAQLSREIKKSERASKRAADQSKKTREAYRKEAKAAASLGGELAKTVISIELMKKAFQLAADGIRAVRDRALELDKTMGGELNARVEESRASFKSLFDQGVAPLVPALIDLSKTTRDFFSSIAAAGSVGRFAEGLNNVASGALIAAREIFGLNEETKQLVTAQNIANGAIDAVDQKMMDAETAVKNLNRRMQEYRIHGDVTTEGLKTFTDAIAEASKEVDHHKETLLKLHGEQSKDTFQRGEYVAAVVKTKETVVEAAKAQAAGIISARKKERESYIASANERQAMADRAIADEERAAAAQEQAIARVAAARDAAAEEERSLRSSLAVTAIETASNVADSIIDGLQNVLLANVQEAKKRRDIELGLAILRGELQAAAAFGTTLATYGGTPQGFALAAAAAAAVGISSKAAAGAAHAGSAEKFHSGGLARDESTAVLRAGEGILTPAAVSAVGGERGLQDLNAGASAMGDNGARTLQIGARAFDALVSQSLTSRGSVLTRSLASLRARPGGYKVHG
jgi:hypothetical protein